MRRLFFLPLFLALGIGAAAAQPTAVATLSRKEIAVGEDVELDVHIAGGSQLRWQGALQIDGLEISGPQMESPGLSAMMRGGIPEGITLAFSITANRAGEFTIPAISLSVDGRAVRTEPIVLKVQPDSAGTQRKRSDQLASIEIAMQAQPPYYVGQVIPVDLRLSAAATIRWQPEAMPELGGDDFTKMKFPEPRQQQGERDGEAQDVYVFRTAITPIRAGKLTLGPVVAPYAAIIPRAKPRHPRSFFDDVFSDPAFGSTQHLKAQAEARELEVKPLPSAGRPESFSGGIGDFIFVAEGSPTRVKMGDPITMKLTIKGSGNFDRVSAPVMKSSAGWRTYPPSADFHASDDLGIAGTKTFSMAVIPEAPQKTMPVFEFSYFNPHSGKYVTLSSQPERLDVEGSAPPAPSVATLPQSSAAPSGDVPTPEAAPAQANDILGPRYELGTMQRTFAPLYLSHVFWAAQGVPALALLGWIYSRRRRASAEERMRKIWKRERATLQAKLRASRVEDSDFLETAAQLIRLETAITTGREVSSIDAAAALSSRKVDAETAEGIERIFNARAAMLYAGGLGGGGGLSENERQEVLATVERFGRSHARR